MKYVKETPRIIVKIIDADTEKTLLEYTDRTWMNVGELFQDYYVTELIKSNLPKNVKKPNNVMVLAIGEYSGK